MTGSNDEHSKMNRGILQRWVLPLALGLVCGCATPRPLPTPTAVVQPSAFAKWESAIAAFESQDKTNAPGKGGILFIGSSIIRLWKTLAADFPEQSVVNRGFGGSQIIDSVHFADRIVFGYEPRLIVLYAGGNDINAKKTPAQVFADFKSFVKRTRAKLPNVRVAYISIAPNPARWSQIESVREVNKLIADYIKSDAKLSYIDVYSQMLGADGMPLPEIFVADRLHMNEKGYAIWKRVVGPHLK